MIENHASLLKGIKELKPYIIEFKEDVTMKSKVYPDDCLV